MKRFLLILAILAPFSLQAGITEVYVSAVGSGGTNGVDAANAMAFTNMINQINLGGAGGNRYNFLGSIARAGTADTISGSGSTNAPVIIRGYASSIGDGYLGRTNANNGLIPTNLGVVTYTGTGGLTVSGSYIVFESLSISGAKNGAQIGVTGSAVSFRGCVLSNATSGSGGIVLSGTTGSGLTVQNCDLTLSNGGNAGSFCLSFAQNFRLIGSRITSSSHGVKVANAPGDIIFNQIYGCAGYGITNANTTVGGSTCVLGNTIAGCTNDAIAIVGNTAAMMTIVDNCITDNSGYGINAGNVGNIVFISNNRTRDNTGGAINAASDWFSAMGWGEVTTDTGGPETDYTNVSITDYRLISASPAVGVGLPLYYSLGAVQPQSTGGTTTTVVHSFPIFQ